MKKPLVIAHRGASTKAPENTMAAFDRALRGGAEGLECDIRLTRDGIPVIIHDRSLERTTGTREEVANLTLAEITRLDAGSWFDPGFSRERIPTLDQFLDLYGPLNLLLNLELKSEEASPGALAAEVLQRVSARSLEKSVILSSFDPEALEVCRRLNPAVRRGLIYLEETGEPWALARSLDCYSVHPLFIYLGTAETRDIFNKFGLALFPWTVNGPAQALFLAEAGVEGIITDLPLEIGKALAAHEKGRDPELE